MNDMLRRIEQWFCRHPQREQIRRTDGRRLFVECLVCGKESNGIVTGGLDNE